MQEWDARAATGTSGVAAPHSQLPPPLLGWAYLATRALAGDLGNIPPTGLHSWRPTSPLCSVTCPVSSLSILPLPCLPFPLSPGDPREEGAPQPLLSCSSWAM